MASYNVFFVIDVDQQTEFVVNTSCGSPHPLKQWILSFLLHFGNKYGIDKVRWGYKFFYSRLPRSSNFISRGSDFREITEKSFDDFESEFSSKCDGKSATFPAHQKLNTTPAAAVQNALKEALLDFQWDRPDITSPTKLTLRPRRGNRFGRAPASPDDELSNQGNNVLFVLTRCPHARADLEEFVDPRGKSSGGPKDMCERILHKGLHDILLQRRVVLHWIDTTPYCQAMTSEDNLGSDAINDALRQMGGCVVPMDALHTVCHPNAQVGIDKEYPSFGRGQAWFPLDSSIGYILNSKKLHLQAFPCVEGVLRCGQDVTALDANVSLKPLSSTQSLLSGPVVITLKSLVHNWNPHMMEQAVTECWTLQATGDQPDMAQLLKDMSMQGICMVADVSCGGLTHSAVLSPLSTHTALLTILPSLTVPGSPPVTADADSQVSHQELTDLPEVVNSVLSVVYDLMKDDDHRDGENTNDRWQIPDWAKQELRHGCSSVSAGLVENWFPESDESGVSANLMESMRLLHAAPDDGALDQGEELPGPQQELLTGLSELYQSSTAEGALKGKKRGAQRTPVRQKMKTMSRSLQMLNFARLNVKAQKSHMDPEPMAGGSKGMERAGKWRSGDQAKSSSGTMHFKSEAELVSGLKCSYQRAVEERQSSFHTVTQNLLTMVTTFLKRTKSSEEQTPALIEKSLLKTSKSVRQQYGNAPDSENKIRECQLQAALRLALCQQMHANPEHSEHVEEMVEEVADMLRIISLTRDPVYLAKFMQDEVLPVYLTAIPRILADVYNSLGTQLPEALVAVLPSDFFSDDSVQKDSVSPAASSVSVSLNPASDAGERLEELRTRSARKKRNGMLTRHRSVTEASQSLRQIEMPRKSTRVTKPKSSVSVEEVSIEQPPPQKQAVQEVTKVRRNLFNQVKASPSKRSKMPRSQSVSAVEGLRKRKRSQTAESSDHHALLTKKVMETPLHKQVSNRLLHRQITGRRSGESDVSIVEESPVKPSADLRRSPRIKNFARRHSSVFYSSSQPRSRNLERVLSSSQLPNSEGRIGSVSVGPVKSPVRLLFGAAKSPGRPSTSSEAVARRSSRRLLLGSTESDVFESPTKTPRKSPCRTPRKSPHKLHPPVTGRGTPRRLRSSSEALGSPGSQRPATEAGSSRALWGSPSRHTAQKSLDMNTPKKSPPKGLFKTPVKKDSPLKGLLRTPGKNDLSSPLKGILKTPVKTLLGCISPGGAQLFQSPSTRTPKKSVTWSPSPRKLLAEPARSPFKVPESPRCSTRTSPRLRTPGKAHSPDKNVGQAPNVFQTPEKTSGHVDQTSPVIPPLSFPKRPSRSRHTPVQDVKGAEHWTPPELQNKTPTKSPSTPNGKNVLPEQTRCMLTRSSRTPLKDRLPQSPCKTPGTARTGNATWAKSDAVNASPKDARCKSDVAQGRRYSLRRSSTHESLPAQSDERYIPTTDQTHEALDVQGANLQCDSSQSAERQAQDGSSSDSQHLDSSEFSVATTEDDSIDISEASVVRTQLTGGIKMNISFTRKSSQSSVVPSGSEQAEHVPTTPPSRNYGFRQTPDRQQREAAARLGYATTLPKFSTPRASKPKPQQSGSTPGTLTTYQVELDMQASGLPKLRIKRTNSFSTADGSGDGMARVGSPNIRFPKTPRVDSPLAHCAKHRGDPGCRSPSLCPRGTPAKGGTPGKGGIIQTHICQSYTPTHTPGGTPSPPGAGAGELFPWTPSPQSRADGLNGWPRKKRVGMVSNKEQGVWGQQQPLREEMEDLEDPELEGVFRLQETEECKDPAVVISRPRKRRAEPSPAQGLADVLDQVEDMDVDMDWTEALVSQFDTKDARTCDDIPWLTGSKDSLSAVVTPPSSKVKKPVTASGILALTQSPLLFKDKTSSARKKRAEMEDESCKGVGFDVDQSPVSQPRRQIAPGRPYSRKRLLN